MSRIETFKPDVKAASVVVARDGTGDYNCDGTADDVQIQAAIDSLSSTGGIVFIKKGTYNITATIVMKDNVILQGEGYASLLNSLIDDIVINMSCVRPSIKDLRIDTTDVTDYSSEVIKFLAGDLYVTHHESMNNIYINGDTDSSNGSKAISLIDDAAGTGIVWMIMNYVHIRGYNYGIYMETNNASAYIKGNKFNKIQFVNTYYGVYQNVISGSSGGIAGNTYELYMNGEATINSLARVDGRDETFYSVVFDAATMASSDVYILTANTFRISIYDPLLTSTYISDSGADNNLILSLFELNQRDVEFKRVYLKFTANSGTADSIKFANTAGDERIKIAYDNVTPAIEFHNRSDDATIRIAEDGTITLYGTDIGDDTAGLNGAAMISTGSGAPSSTPSKEGNIYVDTTGGNVYMSKGTASSADWVQVN